MVSRNDRSTTTRSGQMMPRWLAAAAASVTLAVALAATPTDAPEPGSAEPGSAEPAVTHAGIIDSIFEVFQDFIGWRGYYDDPPREPSDGW